MQEFRRKSFLISSALAFMGVMAFVAIGAVAFNFYQQNKLQQEETLRQAEETLHQARAGALVAAALSRSHTNNGNARLGALIALSVTPESRSDDDPRYHKSPLLSMAFSPDGSRIVSGSWDKTLRLWDAKTGKSIGKPLQEHGRAARIFTSLGKMAELAEKLCPLSEAERQQLGRYDPQTKATAKSLTPRQSWACGEPGYP